MGGARGVRVPPATPPAFRSCARGGAGALDAAQAVPQHPVRYRRHDPDARGRRARPGGRASPTTRSPWPAGACTARRTWDGCRGWGPSRVRLALVEDRTGGSGAGARSSRASTPLDARAVRADPAAPVRRAFGRRAAGAAPPAGPPPGSTPADRAGAPRPRDPHRVRGVVCDARSDDDRVVPGQRFAVTLEMLEQRRRRRARWPVTLRAGGRAARRAGPQRRRCLAARPRRAGRRQVTVQVADDARADGRPISGSPSDTGALYDWTRRGAGRAGRAVRAATAVGGAAAAMERAARRPAR